MFYSILFLFIILNVFNDQISAQQSCVHSSDPLIRCTTQGLIRGLRHDFLVNSSNSTTITTESQSVYAFLGIPYGEPPVGQERFRKPIAKRPWARGKIHDTTTLPNSCYQMIINFFNASGEKIWAPFTPLSEDCLYLNIWTPTTARQQPLLAVMVWIYGGGFTSGTSTLKVYDGSILAATQNVIVISIEYRVDSLGFLYLNTTDAPGNQGLYDQLLAFEWIYNNIKNFGGNPQNITLFGESAGGVSIGLHMLSPKTRHLFSNAILQSSGPTAKWAVLEPHIARYRSERFINNLTNYIVKHYEAGPSEPKYNAIPEECRKPLITIQDKFLCVKNYPILSHDHFVESWAVDSYNGGPIGYSFVPTIDSDFIPYDPEQMLIKGDYKRCPILLGVNQDEGAYFNVYVPQGNMTHDTPVYVDYEAFQNGIREYFQYIPIFPTRSTPMVLESILQRYTKWDDFNNTKQNALQLSFAVGDYHLACPTVFLADVFAQEKIPVYFYHFTLRASTSPWHEWMGVLHGDEVMFIFGEPLNTTDELHYTHKEIIASQKIMRYWTNFAKYGNPNQHHDAQWANEWKLYKWPTKEHIVLNINLSQNQPPDHGLALRADYCSFWLDFIPKLTRATANIGEEEARWKEEFSRYQQRIQEWDYYYSKYLELLGKNKEKLINCLG